MKKSVFILTFLLIITSYGISQWVNVSTPSLQISSIANINSTLFASTSGNGVYRSTNNGDNWASCNNGLNTVFTYNLTVSGNRIYVHTSGSQSYLFYSDNFGDLWTQAGSGLTMGGFPSLVYASGQDVYVGYSNKLVKSTNGGQTWDAGNSDVQGAKCYTKIGNTIFIGTYATGVFKSTNDGVNWTACNNGLTTLAVLAITASGNNLFAGTNYGGALYKSTNLGESWDIANSGITFLTITALTSYENHIFAAARDYAGCIYHSTNYGTNWLIKNQGFPVNPPTFSSLLIANNFIFAGASGGGIWRRLISDIISVENISEKIPEKFSLEQNYPNPFNSSTNVKFQIINAGRVKLVVFDFLGREIKTLVNEKLSPGTYKVSFNANGFSSGIYFYRLISEDFIESKQMVLIK